LKHGTTDYITSGAVPVGGSGTPTALHGEDDVEAGTSLAVAELAPTPEDVEALVAERIERYANELIEQRVKERVQREHVQIIDFSNTPTRIGCTVTLRLVPLFSTALVNKCQ
jgi:hypothetical protein